ncbi:MAG: Uma2 family endonuclease [Dehalococcoidia bacterium]
MTATPTHDLMTAEQLMRLPDDGMFHELDEGRLICMPPSAFESGRVATLVSFFLLLFVRERDLGTVTGPDAGVILRRGPDTVRAPDVSFVRRERVTDTGRGYFEGTPDLVVEVLSPSDRYAAVARKMSQYLATGARLGWVIDPYTRSAAVHRPERRGPGVGRGRRARW